MSNKITQQKIKNLVFLVMVFLFPPLLFFGFAPSLYSQEALALTVTPPLFQLTVGPGEFWASSLKVVNTNPYDLTVYAKVMDFRAEGENGQSKFTPYITTLDEKETQSYSLASWLNIPTEPVFIPSGTSGDIPFSVKVPENAEPGGHYAAILVGTQPGSAVLKGPTINVSSFVSSLLFVRIEGEMLEKGRIREFTSDRTLFKTPKADFTLRFENVGNVHLKPQGDITIYNMWGKERGRVLVNQKGNFGNVLPESIRKFEFSWTGEESVFEIGRYSAIATLAYGQDEKKNISAETYFWIIPIVPVMTGLSSFGLFIFLMFWFVRRYIKRVVFLEKKRMGFEKEEPESFVETEHTLERFIEPFKEGVIDLRTLNTNKNSTEDNISAQGFPLDKIEENTEAKPLTILQFIKKYKLFFLFLIIIIVGAIGFSIYFKEVLVQERSFDVIIKEEIK